MAQTQCGGISVHASHVLQFVCHPLLLLRFGISMEHTLEIEERQMGLMCLENVRVHVCPSPEASIENIRAAHTGWAGDEQEQEQEQEQQVEEASEGAGSPAQEGGHVMVAVTAVFHLTSTAKVNYFYPGPPRYDMSVSGD